MLSTTALACGSSPPPAEPGDGASKGYGRQPAKTPPEVERALEGLRRFHEHQGQKAIEDPTPHTPGPTESR
jgi:hypothetical protein